MDPRSARPGQRPPLVIVSGAPATGKATLARPLADGLCLPLLSKDRYREILAEAFEVQIREQSRALVTPTFAIYHGVVQELLAAGYAPTLDEIVAFIRERTAPERSTAPSP